MANSPNLATLVTLAIAATLLGHTAATTYTVGGSVGWTYPPNKTFYETWASQYTFTVGDVLVFNFTTGQHTVATIKKESFDTCDLSDKISEIENGPASITLNSTGVRYYACSVGQHCISGGQKLAINVTASTASPPSSAPPPSVEPSPSPLLVTPSPSTTPPALGPGGPDPVIPSPPPSGAERSSLAKIFTVFISAVVCLLL